MTMAARPGRFYYGWTVTGLCMVSLMIMVGTTSNAYPLYILPVSHAYGLSRANMNSGMVLMNAGSAVSALFVGRWLDRYSARAIMATGALLLGASLITLGLSHSLWLSAVMLALPVGSAMCCIGSLTGPALMARWFVVHRSRAMAFVMMGMTAGTVCIVPLMAMAIDRLGWRESLVTVGCIATVLLLAINPFVRNAPGPDDRETASLPLPTEARREDARCEASSPTSGQLLRNPRFWSIGLSTALIMALFQGVLVSLVPIGHAAGFSNPRAASLISALGLAAICAKSLVALAGDRFDRSTMLGGFFIVAGAACITLLFAHGYAPIFAACLMMGFSVGASMPLYLAVLADQFGAMSFGKANGIVTFLISVLGACAMRYSGEVYDRTGNYDLMLVSFAIVAVLAAVLLAPLARRSRKAIAASVQPVPG